MIPLTASRATASSGTANHATPAPLTSPAARTALPAFPALRGKCPLAPPPDYAAVPVGRVTLWDGSYPWLVTGYRDVRTVLGDQRFSADPHRPGFPFPTAGYKALMIHNPALHGLDAGGHTRLQRLISADFRTARVEALRPQIRCTAEELADRMASRPGPADLVAEYALPIPSRVICLALGVPYEDHAFFDERARLLVDHGGRFGDQRRAAEELLGYLEELAGAVGPETGLIGRLAAEGELSRPEIAGIGQLLLLAGYETTANMIALSVLALLRNPDQWQRLRREPELTKQATDELLRYLSVAHSGISRVATEDTTLGGRRISAGEGVLCMLPTANRDAAAFPSPDDLDLGRGAAQHLAFGFGAHRCLGHRLAHVEIQIALETLLRRLPGIELAVPVEELRFREQQLVYGVEELPVLW
ncbi:cytochrome P450 [Kitasatospora sp. McL0602]|uniref:cytochrome P450 n=1 Tax=Kitasatospora sp. McL0602 TaxID=3439530 RepID=UPI003F88F93E